MKTIHQNQTVEWSFNSKKARRDPFNDIELSVCFTHAGGSEAIVPAFWGGGRNWRVRFSSAITGKYRFRTICSDPADSGLHGQEGAFEVNRYSGSNPLYRHGPIRIAADQRHFEHADGAPFFWLGDTWWMGLCKRLTWPKGFQTLTRDRVKKGFTVIQIVAGAYPDMPAFDARGANEAGFPWQKDYRRIEPAYFDKADRRIRHLVDAGLVPCIVGGWGYSLMWMGVKTMQKHWRNLVARYGSYPVAWCLAGEGTMAYYLSPHTVADSQSQKKGWNEVGAYVRKIDPYRRPITLHPGTSGRKELATPQYALAKKTRRLASITEGWRFRIDPGNCGETECWQRMAESKAWKPIQITQPWTEQGYDHHGAAWYAVDCATPSAVENPAYLLFHAVDGTAKVWIDGELAGEQRECADVMWDQPWVLDVSRQVASKTRFRIVIKVVKERFNCGIYRPVELRVAHEERIPDKRPGPAAIPPNLPGIIADADATPSVLDFDMLQTGHRDRASLPNTVKYVRESWRTRPPMPVVIGEVCYEGLGEFCRPEVQRMMFWAGILNGATGHTYGANGIWQMNTIRRPYGPSPHGMSWGNTPWEEAYRLPGSCQLGQAKRFLLRYPWWQFEPHPEWVTPGWTDDLCALPFTAGLHDVPIAAGIPGKLRIIYVPMGPGLREVRQIEKDVHYRVRLFNPVSGAEQEIGAMQPGPNGNWAPKFSGFAECPFPVYQDWVVVLETPGVRLV